MHEHYRFRIAQATVAPRHPDEHDADPQRRGMAPIGLRRKRAPGITSTACAAQYFCWIHQPDNACDGFGV
jgi:hypothetical protein